ncbi:MAG: PilZ domain-containing protein [Sedimenticolaceae bacterium]
MEKRQHTRIALDAKGWRAELIDQVSGDRLGEVVNLAPGGLMLLTPHTFEIENLYQVECRATGPDGQSARFTAGLMVLWRSDSNQPDAYWAGLQIIDIDAPSQAGLLALSEAMASTQ